MKIWLPIALLGCSACHLLQSEGAACNDFTHCPSGQLCCNGECSDTECLTPCAGNLSCPTGSVCNPERDLCVPEIAVGCEQAEQVCPDTVQTGDPCEPENAFVPCSSEAVACEQGCRTCERGSWSECSPGTCTLGNLATCASCTDDCTPAIQNATPICRAEGAGFTCDYTEPCSAGFADSDGLRNNGCEAACVPSNGGLERCDGVDNDCDGSVDDLAAAAIDADCAAQYDQSNVAAWSCTAGACRVETCNADAYDLNGSVLDGCEYACPSSGVPETCNGVDDDCNGIIDDMADPHPECATTLTAAVNVQTFTCTAGACSIAACVPGYRNTDNQAATGCDSTCTGSVAETCDGIDNDCNGIIDDAPDDATGCVVLYRDDDGDGDGDINDSRCICAPTGAYTTNSALDCADDDPMRSGLSVESCDNIDNDCNNVIDDGLLSCRCTNGTALASEICYDGIDDNCNGVIDDGCSCPPSLPFCVGDRTARATCDATGNDVVVGSTTACSFLCSQAACAEASNVASTDTAGCTATAPPLAIPSGGTLAYTSNTIFCSPHCGDGSTTEIQPSNTIALGTGEAAHVFCLSRVSLPADIELTAHTSAPEAMILLVAGDAEIDGTLNFDGRDGIDGPGASLPGGVPGPGGWAGASGCADNNCSGTSGEGPGGGHGGWGGGTDGASGGGGGAGFGGSGGKGGDAPNGTGGLGGDAYGTESLIPLTGGSGGGSGGDGAGGIGSGPGGGGGGALQLSVRGTLTLHGTIHANGGKGGSPLGSSTHGPGGGGSGGGILLEAGTLVVIGTVEVSGGRGGSNTGSGVGGSGATDSVDGTAGSAGTSLGGGGGGGAAGRVRLNSASGTTCSAHISPAPACTTETL